MKMEWKNGGKWIHEPHIIEISGGHIPAMPRMNLQRKFATGILKTEFMSFLDKNK